MVVVLLPQESAFGNKLKSGRGYLADHLRFLDAMQTRNSSEISPSGRFVVEYEVCAARLQACENRTIKGCGVDVTVFSDLQVMIVLVIQTMSRGLGNRTTPNGSASRLTLVNRPSASTLSIAPVHATFSIA